jgi:rSAM/selenodomain-associated transferase 2
VRLAVVIPTLDEARSIEGAIAAAISSAGVDCDGGTPLEVIVADGASGDDTAERARAAGARVVMAPRGRGAHQETGWRASRGDVVLFLHADTRLPTGWAGAVLRALADARVVGGAFRLRFAPRTRALAVIEWGAALRARVLGLPYGDQALFARRSALEAIGGIPPVAILEDLDLVRALRRHGRLVLLPERVVTSSRRYLERGVLRTWAANALALVAWMLGVERRRIAAWTRR